MIKNILIKHNEIIFFTILSILCIVMDWIKWDIITELQEPLFSWLIVFLISSAMFGFAGIFAIIFYIKRRKKSFFIVLIPLAILGCIIFFQTFIEYTPSYAKLNYNLHKKDRNMITQLFAERKITQIGDSKFLLSSRYRFCSKTGCVYTKNGYNLDELRFYIQLGIRKSSVFYVKDPNALPKGFENEKFKSIQKLEEHWYWALSQ